MNYCLEKLTNRTPRVSFSCQHWWIDEPQTVKLIHSSWLLTWNGSSGQRPIQALHAGWQIVSRRSGLRSRQSEGRLSQTTARQRWGTFWSNQAPSSHVTIIPRLSSGDASPMAGIKFENSWPSLLSTNTGLYGKGIPVHEKALLSPMMSTLVILYTLNCCITVNIKIRNAKLKFDIANEVI